VDAGGVDLPPTGVDEGEAPPDPLGVVGDPVAGHPGDVLDDRLAPADDAVDEGRLADVGPADHGDDRQRARCGLGLEVVVVTVEQRAVLVAELEVLETDAQGSLDGVGVCGRGGGVLGAHPTILPHVRGASVHEVGRHVRRQRDAVAGGGGVHVRHEGGADLLGREVEAGPAGQAVGEVEDDRLPEVDDESGAKAWPGCRELTRAPRAQARGGHDGSPGLQGQPGHPLAGRREVTAPAPTLGKDAEDTASTEHLERLGQRRARSPRPCSMGIWPLHRSRCPVNPWNVFASTRK
jgi:hypothetical protein